MQIHLGTSGYNVKSTKKSRTDNLVTNEARYDIFYWCACDVRDRYNSCVSWFSLDCSFISQLQSIVFGGVGGVCGVCGMFGFEITISFPFSVD